jgi:hypothetical protein
MFWQQADQLISPQRQTHPPIIPADQIGKTAPHREFHPYWWETRFFQRSGEAFFV